VGKWRRASGWRRGKKGPSPGELHWYYGSSKLLGCLTFLRCPDLHSRRLKVLCFPVIYFLSMYISLYLIPSIRSLLPPILTLSNYTKSPPSSPSTIRTSLFRFYCVLPDPRLMTDPACADSSLSPTVGLPAIHGNSHYLHSPTRSR
jgi:hypothetical protein